MYSSLTWELNPFFFISLHTLSFHVVHFLTSPAWTSPLLCEATTGVGVIEAGGAAESSLCWVFGKHVEGRHGGRSKEEAVSLGGGGGYVVAEEKEAQCGAAV